MTEENVVRTAAKLYEARDTAKLLLGNKYDTKIAVLIPLLKQTAEENNISVLNAAQKIANGYLDQHNGMGALVILAAAVELCERPE